MLDIVNHDILPDGDVNLTITQWMKLNVPSSLRVGGNWRKLSPLSEAGSVALPTNWGFSRLGHTESSSRKARSRIKSSWWQLIDSHDVHDEIYIAVRAFCLVTFIWLRKPVSAKRRFGAKGLQSFKITIINCINIWCGPPNNDKFVAKYIVIFGMKESITRHSLTSASVNTLYSVSS